MGLLSLFGKSPLSDKKIAKVAKLAANPFAQPDVRMREMQRLIEDGSDAALRGVLKRFASNAQGHIADEDEKKWLEDALVEVRLHGALPALQDYMQDTRPSSPTCIAGRSPASPATPTRPSTFFLDVLRAYGPDDHRSSEAKLQLVWQLSESMSGQVIEALIPFLRDHSDDVRWAVLELTDKAADRNLLTPAMQTAAAAEMLGLLTDSEISPRISRRTAELAAQREWVLPAGNDPIAAVLDEEFFLDKKRYVRRRNKK